ncbi:hypothetical protein O3P69_008618 [Scylla paramamosain]|uniref:Serpin domain-containing protein n=1 Tax=Scylla paramamosain TaxID=85552 RepID=A0AAW0SPH0_SCYPA
MRPNETRRRHGVAETRRDETRGKRGEVNTRTAALVKRVTCNEQDLLESSLSSAKWSELLRSMLPNTVNLKMPVFRHRAFHNFSTILSDLGLRQLFQKNEADFSGINHIKNLYLNDVVQLTEFQSCQIEKPRTPSVLSGRRRRSSASSLGTLMEDNTAESKLP